MQVITVPFCVVWCQAFWATLVPKNRWSENRRFFSPDAKLGLGQMLDDLTKAEGSKYHTHIERVRRRLAS